MRIHALTLFAALALLFASGAEAARFPTPEPLGIPLIVDSIHDANFQTSVASDGRGNTVAVWTRWADGGNQSEVVGQRFDAAGNVRGKRFRANTFLQSYQGYGTVAMNAGGRFAIAWVSFGQDEKDPNISRINARVYDNQGAPLTGELRVSTSEGGQDIPTIGIDRKGNFTVAWYNQLGVRLRRFTAAGVPLGPETGVASGSNPALAVAGDGRLTLVWRDWDLAASSAVLRGRRFGRTGEPSTPELAINSRPITHAGTPRLALTPDGGFVVAWDRCNFFDYSEGCEVRLRRFDAQGKPLAADVTVSPADRRGHELPAVAVEPGGYAAISWQNCALTGGGQTYDCKVETLFFDPTGRAAPAPQRLTADADFMAPAVTAGGGLFVVTYESINCDAARCDYTFPLGAYAWRYLIPRP